MAQSFRIYQKGKLVFDQLSFRQQDMVKIGTVGVAAVIERVLLGRGPTDGPAKPLRNWYARLKQRKGLIPRRDLMGTGFMHVKQLQKGKLRISKKTALLGGRFVGHMMDNLSLRTVTENSAKAGFTQNVARIKAQANEKREPFVTFSPKNREAVTSAAAQIFRERIKTLVKAG